MDTALDDFMNRFGPDDYGTGNATTKLERGQATSASTLTPAKSTTATPEITGGGLASSDDLKKGPTEGPSLASKAGGMATQASGAITPIMGLVSNAQGGQFDTSADGGGVGDKGGAVLHGASQGAQAGKALGSLAGPMGSAIGTAAGAIGGGLISSFAHDSAVGEYEDNLKKRNLKESALETAERKETYAMSKGLESMENLKALRQKQLGI